MNATVPGKRFGRPANPKGTKSKKDEATKKQKKVKEPKPTFEYYLPAATEIKKPTLILGYGMRALLAALLSAAFSNFLCDSFNIIAINRASHGAPDYVRPVVTSSGEV